MPKNRRNGKAKQRDCSKAIYVFGDHVFGTRFAVFAGDGSEESGHDASDGGHDWLDAAVKAAGGEFDAPPDVYREPRIRATAAYCTNRQTPRTGFFYFDTPKDFTAAVCAHEAFHCTVAVLDAVEVGIRPDDMETGAYFIAFVVRELLEAAKLLDGK